MAEVTPPPWSYSSITLFKTCPRKYQAERVTKEVPFRDTEATLYGKAVHTAAEEYVRDGKPIDPKYQFIEPVLRGLKAIRGEKHCELKVGIKKTEDSYEHCDFFDPDVWFRGVADLVILREDSAFVVDFKTSKSSRYADSTQLALMSLAVFLKHPNIQYTNAALVFLVVGAHGAPVHEWFIKETYKRESMYKVIADLYPVLKQRKRCYETGEFPATRNGLCSAWCQVSSCIHHGKRR